MPTVAVANEVTRASIITNSMSLVTPEPLHQSRAEILHAQQTASTRYRCICTFQLDSR